LDPIPLRRFCNAVFLAVIKQAADAAATSPNSPFFGYPPWLVVLVGTIVAVVFLWLFGKVMKWAWWLLIILVLVGGIVAAGKMFLGL
jgi:hypothetical protein